MRDIRNFIHNTGMSEETIDTILHFHPIMTMKEFNMFKFLSNNIYKFNQENDEWEVDYIPLYSTEDYPYWVCDFIIIKTDKATGKKIPFDKYSRLEMSYLEHLFDVNDSESLRRFFVDYKICYDLYYQKNSLNKCYTNKIEE